jgi:hypothetical protein
MLITVGREDMNECGCVISPTTKGICVKLCSAHGYGTEMLPVLRRCLDIFRDLEVQHGQRLLAAYADTLHEAQALLCKIDERQEEVGRHAASRRPQTNNL